MGVTSIEWTDRSVNPIRARNKKTGATGHYCEKISPGCANCYSSRFQPRVHMPYFGGARKLPVLPLMDESGVVSIGDELEAFFDDERLKEVLRRKQPTKWFWCDMTDMFGSWVPPQWIDKCFAMMALTPQHTHQVLTKRPERMAEYLESRSKSVKFWQETARSLGHTLQWDHDGRTFPLVQFPLRNVWLGTSVENQKLADERIPHLLKCPAAVRFLSCEPLLERPDLSRFMPRKPFYMVECEHCGWIGTSELCDRVEDEIACSKCSRSICGNEVGTFQWVIVGGESGGGARECNAEWIRSIVQQCKSAGVACFVKQTGTRPIYDQGHAIYLINSGLADSGKRLCAKGSNPAEWPADIRVRQMPEVR